ncbi:MAG: DNA topoisomerase I, partial [Alphaproteobacteria bacterium]|nr:DNA topoisomerase I [Alphaproteobacteria bacterium]
ADDDVLTIGLNRAISLLAEPSRGRRAAPTPLRELGPHPDDQERVAVFSGRYGPYVSHDGLFASLPKSMTPETVTLDDAVELLRAQAAKGKKPRKARGKPRAASTASAKPAKKTGKKTAKKTAAKSRSGAAKSSKPAASN